MNIVRRFHEILRSLVLRDKIKFHSINQRNQELREHNARIPVESHIASSIREQCEALRVDTLVVSVENLMANINWKPELLQLNELDMEYAQNLIQTLTTNTNYFEEFCQRNYIDISQWCNH